MNFDHQYNTLFWTIERDPSLKSLNGHRQAIRDIFTDHYGKGIRLCVASEISDTGYHHDHVVTYTPSRQKVGKKFIRKVQANASFKKLNGSKASVRVFHPRRGSTDDFTKITKYLTESNYKAKTLDDGSITFDDPFFLYWAAFRVIPNTPLQSMLSSHDGQAYWNEEWQMHDWLTANKHFRVADLLRRYLATGPDRTDKPTLAHFMANGGCQIRD